LLPLFITACKAQNNFSKICDHFDNEWQTINDTMGKFEITIPNCNIQKTKQTQIINNANSDIHVTSVNLQKQEHINIAYSISYQKYEYQDPNSVFETQKNYAMSGTNFELQYESVADTLGAKVRELYFTSTSYNLIMLYKLFLHKDTFYKLIVITEKGKSHNKSIRKFIDSFKLIEH
jgi:hypothetical protein